MEQLVRKSIGLMFEIVFKFMWYFLKSVFKLTIKGNTFERISLMVLLGIDYICLINGYIAVQCISVLIIMIIGGLKK